jgi:Icc-related predicted phosphoesterase
MKITAISDLHGHYPELDGGDLLIIAGDLTKRDSNEEYIVHFPVWLWYQSKKYRKVVFTGGNHDNIMYSGRMFPMPKDLKEKCTYLFDSGCEFDGFKIWGSPWTKTFEGMNPHCKSFTMDTEDELKKKWDLIPDDTDILVTHGPPYLIFDKTTSGEFVGSPTLRERIEAIKPKLHVFGHIHEDGGHQILLKHDGPNTLCVNASIMNEHYKPVNKPTYLEI